MQKKQLTLVIVSLLVVVISVSLAYFTTQIIGKGKDVSVTSTNLQIVFNDTDGEIAGSDIEPGWSATKTFTVQNNSKSEYKYNIGINDLINTFKTYKYLQYKISSSDGGYNMSEYEYLPKASTKEDVTLAYEISIDKSNTHTYTIEIRYINDESVDQSVDMGKIVSGTLYISEFVKPTTKLSDKLMIDNPKILTRNVFSAFTETNTGTLYKATEQIENGEPKDIYYFAGDAQNNWVKFGKTSESSCTYKGKEVVRWFFDENNLWNVKDITSQEECEITNVFKFNTWGYIVGVSEENYPRNTTNEKATWNGTSTKDIYWRIVRTNHDGSIKLLYAGTSPDSNKAYIGASEFNTSYNDPMYAGYMYGMSGSLENNRLNTNSSTIKGVIDTWYQNNLTSYTKYLSKDAVYCNDREVASGYTYSLTDVFGYSTWNRIYHDKQPTYNCINISDAFSVNNTSAKLDYPIGLMSIDELAYAGAEKMIDLNEPYAWYYINANGESSTASAHFWSLSPYTWYDGYSLLWGSIGSSHPGRLDGGKGTVSLAVRPVVSLSPCNLISRGNGSADNPYVIYTGNGVCE